MYTLTVLCFLNSVNGKLYSIRTACKHTDTCVSVYVQYTCIFVLSLSDIIMYIVDQCMLGTLTHTLLYNTQ